MPLTYARAMPTDSNVFHRYYDMLEQTLKSNGIFDHPTHIFNCDETGLPLSPKSLKIVDQMGSKNPSYITGSNKSQITVLACSCAAGYQDISLKQSSLSLRCSLNRQRAVRNVCYLLT